MSDSLPTGPEATGGTTPGACPVLIVEDNPLNQRVMVMLLKKLGYGVDIAKDGNTALAMLQKQVYPVILMDCRLPGMDGYETTRRIRQLPGGHGIAIIGMTASILTDDRQQCLEAGMNDFIKKPVSLEDLSKTLAKLKNAPA